MTRVTHRRGTARDGFALIEMMLALMLIALLAALALPSLVRGTGPATLRLAALEIAALLRQDRNDALSSGRPTFAIVDRDGHRVRSGSSSAAVDMPAGVQAKTTGIGFLANGRSSGGEIVLASDTARLIVAVSPDTGAIHVGAH